MVFSSITSYTDFKERVPLQTYDEVKPFVERLFKGEQNLLWPTDVKWFAKSSGTTSEKSKFIPVTKESLEECHYKGGKDLLSLYYHNYENRKLYKGKHLVIGGCAEINYLNHDSYFGDLSAIIVKNLPWWAEIKRTPKKEIALLGDWEEKIEKLAESTIKEDVYILAGVPSWTLVLLKRILDITGAKHIREVWPNLELFMHGGVSFEPYRSQFEKILPYDDMHYVETYNASEGFFGIQDKIDSNEMLLMLDYGIFFEFIPMSSFDGIHSKEIVSLEHAEVGVNYAIVISSNGGLWRYIIGDTITFTNKQPFKFKITGRTKSYINTFGEEMIVDNADKAIMKACEKTGAEIREYTAGPVYMGDDAKGAHEWILEFNQKPENLHYFMEIVDNTLKSINSDYEAKRSYNMSLQFPLFHAAEPGTFDKWLKSKGKLGGQHKVPRLSNDRVIVEEVMSLLPQ